MSMKQRNTTAFPARALGFSMIEVLIAVLVLAIGLLGVAALQLNSMNSGFEGYFRTQATAIAEDLASRVKSNKSSAQYSPAGLGVSAAEAMETYLTLFVANPYACANPPATFCRPDEATGEAGAECTTDEQVAFDIWEVCDSAGDLLPGGTVAVNRTGSRLSIAVAWSAAEAKTGSGEEAAIRNPLCAGEFGFDAVLDCVVIEVIP